MTYFYLIKKNQFTKKINNKKDGHVKYIELN